VLRTIIVVTHEPDIAAYADRVITMRDGTIISEPAASPQPAAAAAGMGPDRRPPATAEAAGGAGAFWAFATMIMAAAIQALARNKMRSATRRFASRSRASAPTCW
jgi:energy-coupling factor transporter ATP-binding protein EcfA2